MTENIKNRESWLKVTVIAVFSGLVAWELATSPIAITLSDFRISDLLSLIMALFAVGLSVAFYFKATDSSNAFYDNTYKFTKEVSEILGRIEAGFSERLRHLDEGYAGLRDRFDRIPIDQVKAERQVKQELEEVKKKEQERNQLIESLAQKAKLQENEKRVVFEQLREKDDELQNAKRQLMFLQRRLERAEISPDNQARLFPESRHEMTMRRYLRRIVKELGVEAVLGAPENALLRRFETIKGDLSTEFLEDLKRNNFIDEKGRLTLRGIEVLKESAMGLRE
jgi:myosin heavy subunit